MAIKWLRRNTVVTPHLTLCLTEKECHKVFRYLKVPIHEWDSWLRNGFGACTHTVQQSYKLTCVVCIDIERCKTQTLEDVLALLVHEATHVWQQLCDSIGEKHPSIEFEAYSLQCITRELFEDFLERGEWKGKKKPRKSTETLRGSRTS